MPDQEGSGDHQDHPRDIPLDDPLGAGVLVAGGQREVVEGKAGLRVTLGDK